MIAKTLTPNAPFAKLSNAFAQNSNLSLEALGLLSYLLSLPHTWQARTEHLCQRFNICSKTLWKYLKELMRAGLLHITRFRNKNGTFGKIKVLEITDAPLMEPKLEPEACSPQGNFLPVEENPAQAPSARTPEPYQPQGKKFLPIERNMIKKHGERSARAQEEDLKKNLLSSQTPPSQEEASKVKSFFQSFLPSCFNLDLSGLNPQEQEAFHRFITYRSERVKVTSSMKKALLAKMLSLKSQGLDLVECVAFSVRCGFLDVYAPKSHTKERDNKAREILEALMNTYEGLTYDNIGRYLFKLCEADVVEEEEEEGDA
ncbi:hypothetical protein ACFOPX_00925 [Helicobacter baculiformis]|uniref:Helix-turn-helix domain-containing protein n=1 Tax=Helicobacter baculiformis TaxID=427351 RepID=A0ABV7ZHJ3_9HELI|nr:hypothetical protein [Helicobacter baculiformis]